MPRRGADLLAQSLKLAGVKRIFSLSGNQIMSIYDACWEVGIEIIHVRHEAAAVHMADACSRLTGEVSVALLTAGPGHANAISALYSARCSEAPVLMLSGHAPTTDIGRGAFQEMAQVEMAATVCKEAWLVNDTGSLGHEMARAFRTALGGKPGPVHLSLPANVLTAEVANWETALAEPSAFTPDLDAIPDVETAAVLGVLEGAQSPLLVTGPGLAYGAGAAACAKLADALQLPLVNMQSPRGLKDPALGALHEQFPHVDTLVLLGKALDFTMAFGRPPAWSENLSVVHIDADLEDLSRTRNNLQGDQNAAAICNYEPASFAAALEKAATKANAFGIGRDWASWRKRIETAVATRPADWQSLDQVEGRIHPAAALRGVALALSKAGNPIFVSDGGEVGQWAQAVIDCPRRFINGTSGAIGGSLSYAQGIKAADRQATVVAVMGDGTAGFHLSELDTGIRCDLPVVCVIGNDACWNAEHQIQIREFGADRTHSCELLATRYDKVCEAMGGYGECVTSSAEVPQAVERAIRSGKTAVINIETARIPAPNITSNQSP